jgi:hypothetical protein
MPSTNSSSSFNNFCEPASRLRPASIKDRNGAHRLAETELEALVQLNATLRKQTYILEELVEAVNAVAKK